ncbi:nitrilase [Candidatus Bathyarchaeota archaeon]|nr:carbon-nitrogen hydrolase family protein [Candidatus Bathyarchaeota archaeon]NIR15967.1 carbon-nitrogen hydrolase family protein [Desulfobacterales bacterium]NIU81375.1 nitrilase [Candidatus Bathyarchaeota archaeon]NIV67995.1 nitrilase [Candidatus Bathyarchaeota archaeon]NIW34535.1 nitrilase [Candidatus Bathyarchaeota archaeon]
MPLSIACHQLSFSVSKEQNRRRILQVLEGSQTQLDIFPEYAMGLPPSGLSKDFVEENAEPLGGRFVTSILEQTEQRGSSVVFTTFLREDDAVYNAAVFADQGRVRGLYRKIHLFDAYGYRESELFTAGDQLELLDFRGFKVGLAVCFDLRFPELFRSLAYRGADLFIVPSAWYQGEHKLEQWRILTRARAHENTAYLMAVDQARPCFLGHSLVASPLAEVIHEAGEDQVSFTLSLDREQLEEDRKLLPILQLARPDLYRKLV